MRIGIIVGSHRKKSGSQKVGTYVEKIFQDLGKGVSTYTFSLADNPLPLWDEEVWQKTDRWKKVWSPISTELKSCDGFVIISPEWAGMSPPGLKNFFLLCGGRELSHKPAMIVGVSSGLNGHYPVVELRSSSYKNTHICYTPDHVVVKQVEQVLSAPDGASLSEEDQLIRDRLRYSAGILISYSEALRHVRESGVINLDKFPFGM